MEEERRAPQPIQIVQDKPSGMERHVQTALMAIVIALILWLGKTANDNAQQLAVLNVKFTSLEERLKQVDPHELDRRVADIEGRFDRGMERFREHTADSKIHHSH